MGSVFWTQNAWHTLRLLILDMDCDDLEAVFLQAVRRVHVDWLATTPAHRCLQHVLCGQNNQYIICVFIDVAAQPCALLFGQLLVHLKLQTPTPSKCCAMNAVTVHVLPMNASAEWHPLRCKLLGNSAVCDINASMSAEHVLCSVLTGLRASRCACVCVLQQETPGSCNDAKASNVFTPNTVCVGVK